MTVGVTPSNILSWLRDMQKSEKVVVAGQKQMNIIVFFGMVASGKTYLARAYGEKKGIPYYNTDQIRKEMLGLNPFKQQKNGLGKGIYSAKITDKTYTMMLTQAEGEIKRGSTCVLLDGSFGSRKKRKQVQKLAARYGGRAFFIYCFCSEKETRRRLEQRRNNPESVSDGDWEIYQAQQETFDEPEKEAGSLFFSLNTEKNKALLFHVLEGIVEPGC